MGKRRLTKTRDSKNQTTPARPEAAASRWRELLWLGPVLLLAGLLYANTLQGQFVYDDQRQIQRNTLIQNSDMNWRALTSDVWAFKGGTGASSNYWRPTFVLWLILNFRLFGTAHTLPWHLFAIALHLATVALVYAWSRRLDFTRAAAAGIALVFAVHPVHTESVAWISGAPDTLLAVTALASLWFAANLIDKRPPDWLPHVLQRLPAWVSSWLPALLFYALALGAKEIAVALPLLVFIFAWTRDEMPGGARVAILRALKLSAPFAVLALLYMLLRQLVLGAFAQSPIGASGVTGSLLTFPLAFCFYLRQMLFPFWIGPSYGLRPVLAGNIGALNFWLPLLGSGFALALLVWFAWRDRLAAFGLALFLFPLLPVLHTGAFHPEQIVHDRYLYLPLFGFLIVCAAALDRLLTWRGLARKQQARIVIVLTVLCCVPLALQTWRYNADWTSNLRLWQRAIVSDPDSSFNFMQYGYELFELERYKEANDAFEHSLQLGPEPQALVGRGRVSIVEQRYADALSDFDTVISLPNDRVSTYGIYQAYEGTAIAYAREQRYLEALSLLFGARQRLPMYSAALTEKLAVVLYQSGRKEEALTQLEGARQQALTEALPESKDVLLRLGQLYIEFKRPADASAVLLEYLSVTSQVQDKDTLAGRARAQALLKSIQ